MALIAQRHVSRLSQLRPGFDTDANIWQGSGCPSKVGGFLRVLWYPPPHKTIAANAFKNACKSSLELLGVSNASKKLNRDLEITREGHIMERSLSQMRIMS